MWALAHSTPDPPDVTQHWHPTLYHLLIFAIHFSNSIPTPQSSSMPTRLDSWISIPIPIQSISHFDPFFFILIFYFSFLPINTNTMTFFIYSILIHPHHHHNMFHDMITNGFNHPRILLNQIKWHSVYFRHDLWHGYCIQAHPSDTMLASIRSQLTFPHSYPWHECTSKVLSTIIHDRWTIQVHIDSLQSSSSLP